MRALVYIVDIDFKNVVGSSSFTEKYVSKITALSTKIMNVGQNTYWQAQAMKITLVYTILIRQSLYNNEKYFYFNEKLYELGSVGKTNDERDILLNVKEFNNSEIKNVIERYIIENQNS